MASDEPTTLVEHNTGAIPSTMVVDADGAAVADAGGAAVVDAMASWLLKRMPCPLLSLITCDPCRLSLGAWHCGPAIPLC